MERPAVKWAKSLIDKNAVHDTHKLCRRQRNKDALSRDTFSQMSCALRTRVNSELNDASLRPR